LPYLFGFPSFPQRMKSSFKHLPLTLVLILLLLGLTLSSLWVVLRSRIDIVGVNATILQQEPNASAVGLLITVDAASRLNCTADIILYDLTRGMNLTSRNGTLSRFSYRSDSLKPGNYSFRLRVSNALWSASHRLDLTVPEPSHQVTYEWRAVHYGIHNRTSPGDVDVFLHIEGVDAAKVREVRFFTLYWGANSSIPMNRTSSRLWHQEYRAPSEGGVMYHFVLTDSLNKTVRYPARGEFSFYVKTPPLCATEYVTSLRRDDGSFGPTGHELLGGLWWDYHSLETLRLLNYTLHETIRPSQSGYQPEEIYENLRLSMLLGRVPRPSNKTILALRDASKRWTEDEERSGYFGPPQVSEMFYAVRSLRMLNMSVDDPNGTAQWLLERQNPDGGWGNVRGNISHLSFTYYSVGILKDLGVSPQGDRIISFIRRCRDPAGGFASQPGSAPDVRYTQQAISLLRALNTTPRDPDRLATWLMSLQNPDGGFGCKPGWPSEIESTHLAVQSLDMLGYLKRPLRASRPPELPKRGRIDPSLRIYQAVFEGAGDTWGKGESPGYVLGYTRQAGIDLLGLKTSDISYVGDCLRYVKEHKIKIDVVISEEQYGVTISMPSFGTYSHVANIIGRSTLIFQRGSDWDGFREDVGRLHQQGGIIHLQTAFSREFSVAVLDDSILDGEGYDAVSFDYSKYPWTERYWQKVAILFSADAHEDLWQTRSKYDRERALFISSNGSWSGFLDALRHGRVVTVSLKDKYLGLVDIVGPGDAVEFAKSHIDEWAWWRNASTYPKFFPFVITADNPEDAAYRSPQDSHALPLGGGLVRVYNSTPIVSIWLDGRELPVYSIPGDGFWSPYLLCEVSRLESGSHELVLWYREGLELREFTKRFYVASTKG